MDVIVLAKLIHDISAQVDKEEEAERASREASARALALWKENKNATAVPAVSKGPVSPAQYHWGVNNATNNNKNNAGQGSSGEGKNSSGEHRRVPSGESRVPEVFLKGLTLAGKSKEERINEHCGVRDLRRRIKAMKEWRREIERTVYWQREEYQRVQNAIGRQSGQSEGNCGAERSVERRVVQFEVEGDVEGKGKAKEGAEPVKTTGVQRDEGWGVGGQTWEKKRLVWLFSRCWRIESADTDFNFHLVVEYQVSRSGKNCSAMAELDGMTRVFVGGILDADVVRGVCLPIRGQWKHFLVCWIRALESRHC